MDGSTAVSRTTEPDASDFVRFCYQRRRVGWPELYDEMCAVAGRGLYHGYDADDLAGIGIGFSLFDMPALAVLSTRIVAEEQARRRPVSVVITAAVEAVGSEVQTQNQLDHAAANPRAVEADRSATAGSDAREERSFDVPVRLVLAPSGA